MTERHIAEDFRFATWEDVRNYSPTDKIRKPDLPGYDFCQLQDQLQGLLLKAAEENRSERILLRAAGGTSLWLVQQIEESETDAEVLLSVNDAFADAVLLGDLRDYSCVRDVLTGLEANIPLKYSWFASTAVLCCPDEILPWMDLLTGRKCAILCWDPQRTLQSDPQGHYFLGSTVRVYPQGRSSGQESAG